MCTGFVPNWTKSESRGKKILEESGHSSLYLLPPEEEEGIEVDLRDYDDSDDDTVVKMYNPEEEYSLKTEKAQDLHKILAALLKTYLDLQDSGMLWNYKYRGKLYKNIELVFFVAFVKCDGDEADKLTGHYRSRGINVSCLCRYCICPTADGDNHRANYKLKLASVIRELVENNNVAKLKKLSQQNIKNAFDDVRFGLHSDQGIHGACPMELLHHILLGIFKYCRDQFFIQIGLKSAVADEINALAKLLGRLFARQSDRDLPKTNFSKGIFEGKIMGKEFSGVLLLIAAILQTTKGDGLLKNKRGAHFKTQGQRDDWALLVETLLCWEAFLKLDEMEMRHVKRLKKKHHYIMFLMKKIMARTKGMGFKFMKFHGILHLVMDIIHFGVPTNTDTGSNESHHKLAKLCAKLTQRDITVFEKQTATRLVEFLLLDLAMAELEGKTVWEYFVLDQDRGPVNSAQQPENNVEEGADDAEYRLSGASMQVFYDSDKENMTWKFRKGNGGNSTWPQEVVEFLGEVQVKAIEVGVPFLDVRSEHKRNGQIFRGHPNFRKKGIWNDWAVFDWGKTHGKLPGEIWCFVDFSDVAGNFNFEIADCKIQNGIYAVIESTTYEPPPKKNEPRYDVRASDLFSAIIKDTNANGSRKFYLADVESIVATCCVVPDIGSKNEYRFFEVLPRKEWARIFTKWLIDRHTDEQAEMEEEEE